jgi:hypothetical protein
MKRLLNKIDTLLEWLKGKKTYIVSTLGIACAVAYSMGYLTQDELIALGTIFGFSAQMFLRLASK